MRASFRQDEARGRIQNFEVRIGERAFEVCIGEDRCTTSEGRAHDPEIL